MAVKGKAAAVEAREERLKRICGKINEGAFGGEQKDAVTYLGSKEAVRLERFPSGCPALDDALGGGWPKGRFVELFGGEAGGKTTLSLHAISEHQKKYPDEDVALIDTEFCLASGTLVYDASSMVYRPVEDMVGESVKVLSWVDGKMIPQPAKVVSVGERDVYLVRCSAGRKIRLTDNHRVLTQDGYKEVSDLMSGDTMFVPRKLSEYNGSSFFVDKDLELYRILGYHIGDGTVGCAEVATVDGAVVEDLQSIAAKHDCVVTFNGTLARFRKKDLKYYDISEDAVVKMLEDGLLLEEIALEFGCSLDTVRGRIKEYGLGSKYNFRQRAAVARNERDTNIPRSESKYCGGIKSSIYDFLSKFDCFHKYSGQRRMPIGLNNYQLVQVLAGMWMSDGCVIDPHKQHRCAAYYSTTSRILAMDVQAALQRLGVFSSISEYIKPREDGDGYHDVSYNVYIRGREDLARFASCVKLSGYKRDRIDSALAYVAPKSAVRDGKDLIGVEVVSVELDGSSQTFDVSVANPNDECQNFLAEGMIVHNSFDSEYASAIGVDTRYLVVCQPESGEQALNVLSQLINEGVGLILVDSVAALTTRSELEGDIGDTKVAEQARLMSGALRRLTMEAGRKQATVLWTNQVRDKIGISYGDKTTTPAGRALKHYASIRVNVSRIGSVKEKVGGEEVIVANKVKVDVKKNKTASPFRQAEFFIAFGHGIDEASAILDSALDCGAIVRKGARFTMTTPAGDEVLPVGRQAVLDAIRADKVMKDRVMAALVAKRNTAEPVEDEEKPVRKGKPQIDDPDGPLGGGDEEAVEVDEV